MIKYNEEMETYNVKELEEKSDKEHLKKKYRVWTPVKLRDVPLNAKIITSTSEMKNKANRIYRARKNTRGFEQVEGLHYNEENILSPVTSNMSIRIIMVLSLMPSWTALSLYVKFAFLHG